MMTYLQCYLNNLISEELNMRYYKEIRYRLTAEEKTALAALAEQENTSQSAFVRRLIGHEAKKYGLLSSQSAKRGERISGTERLHRKVRMAG